MTARSRTARDLGRAPQPFERGARHAQASGNSVSPCDGTVPDKYRLRHPAVAPATNSNMASMVKTFQPQEQRHALNRA